MAKEIVTINLPLTKEGLDALERLRELTGKETIAETIYAALKLYGLKVVNGVLTADDKQEATNDRS
jgi:hypothetical protein